MSWPVLYIVTTIVCLVTLKMQKRGEVAIIAFVLAAAAAILVVKIWGWFFLIAIKLLTFVAYKTKVLVLKKIAIVALGVVSSIFTAFTVVLPVLIWMVVLYLLWHFFVEFYKGIFAWLQEKLVEIRDWFDEKFEQISPLEEPLRLPLVLPLMAMELLLVAGAPVAAVWFELRWLTGQESLLQDVFAALLCAVVGMQVYASYRFDTHIFRRLRGDGLDYGILTLFAPFDQLTDL